MTYDDLIEKVALALYNDYRVRSMMQPVDSIATNQTTECIACRREADIAIAIILEEAARIAEQFDAKGHGSLATDPVKAAGQAAKEIAGAIRAMKE